MRTRTFRLIFTDRTEHTSELLAVHTNTWFDGRALLHEVSTITRHLVEHVWSEPESDPTICLPHHGTPAAALRAAVRFHDDVVKAKFKKAEGP